MRRAVISVSLALAVVSSGCDPSRHLEGCGDRADAVRDLGLVEASDEPVLVGSLPVRVARGAFYRQDGDAIEVISQPGAVCDSGDWGIVHDNYLRLRVHAEPVAPDDSFADFPSELRGYQLDQLQRPLGEIEYALPMNALAWRARAHLTGATLPRPRLLYLTASVPASGGKRGVSVHYFPGESEPALAALSEALASIEKSTR